MSSTKTIVESGMWPNFMGYAMSTTRPSTTSTIPPIASHRHGIAALTKKTKLKQVAIRAPVGVSPSPITVATAKNTHQTAQTSARAREI